MLTKFTGKVHSNLAYWGTDDNLFYSAYSLNVALGMCQAGSNTLTKEELTTALCLPPDSDEYYQKLINIASDDGKEFKLKIANALWVDNKLNLKDDFSEKTKKVFAATASTVDFENGEESTDLINKWASDNTEEKISKVLSPESVNCDTRLVLTNAVYFKGDWESEFDKGLTADRAFFNCGNVPTMWDQRNVKYYEDDNLKAIELDYKGNELSMIVMLPTEQHTGNIDNSFEATYNNITSYFDSRNCYGEDTIVQIPKFKLETSYDLIPCLKDMGVELAFGTDADFSNISDLKLYITSIIQKAFVNVDEKGTEAAAVTAVVMGLESCCVSRPKEFIADHPFVICIRHKATNTILFSGRIVNPR